MSTFFRFAFQGEEGYGLMESGVGEKITGSPWAGFQRTGQPINLSEITFLPPCQPTKIVCLGLNYRAHAREFDSKLPTEPLIFLKPPSALIGHLGEIAYPSLSARVDFEGELAVIMGKTCKNVSENRAMDFVLGYTCLNDVTARDLQRKDGQWARSKGFDTFCPAGPYLVTGIDPSDLAIQTFLNGEERQSSRTSYLIFPIPFLIHHISRAMTLYPGDIISTGTPSGVGPMKPGDKVEVRVEKVGQLINKVV
jgi:2-keto-4-pentenoate hydratase/2-oxohepta-3-ene-1,7-dioic acid hydratase in catechol pathway